MSDIEKIISNTDTQSTPNMNAVYQIFTDSNIVILVWFLAVYFIVYLLLNIFRGRDGVRSSLSRWVDIVALIGVLIYLGFTYFGKSEDEKKQYLSEFYSGKASTIFWLLTKSPHTPLYRVALTTWLSIQW